MADLISRAAAIEAMRECWRRVNQFAKPFEANRIMDCIKAVKELPAVGDVLHGRWYEIRDYSQAGLISFECSACGRLCDTLYRYCPNCGAKNVETGAKMDGEEAVKWE